MGTLASVKGAGSSVLGDLCSGRRPPRGFSPSTVHEMSQLSGERLEQELGPQMLSRLKEPGTKMLTERGARAPLHQGGQKSSAACAWLLMVSLLSGNVTYSTSGASIL